MAEDTSTVEEASTEETKADKPKENERTFTRDELARAVASQLADAKKAWEAETAEKTKAAASEAARLAKLSKDDREKAVLEKARADFNAEKAAFEQDKLSLEAAKQLNAAGLDQSLADIVVGKDADATLANIKSFKETVDAEVKRQVNEKLATESPKSTESTSAPDGVTKESIMKIENTQERQKAIREHLDLFR